MYQPENERSPFFPLQDIHCVPYTPVYVQLEKPFVVGFPGILDNESRKRSEPRSGSPHSSVMNAMSDRIDASVQYAEGRNAIQPENAGVIVRTQYMFTMIHLSQ